MRLLPVRYTDDVDALLRFYAVLGLTPGTASRSGAWADLRAGGGLLGLHVADRADPPRPAGECELGFEADEPLEDVLARLHAAGHADAHLVDEGFGRSLRVRDPEGVAVQVNESDPTLYA